MIQEVRLQGSTYAEPPSRFEAGTPAIAEAIGLGAACDYLSGLGMEAVAAHERELGVWGGLESGVVCWLPCETGPWAAPALSLQRRDELGLSHCTAYVEAFEALGGGGRRFGLLAWCSIKRSRPAAGAVGCSGHVQPVCLSSADSVPASPC